MKTTILTWTKINSCEERGKCATLQHVFSISIRRKQDYIFSKKTFKHSLEVFHVLMVTRDVAAVLILHLRGA